MHEKITIYTAVKLQTHFMKTMRKFKMCSNVFSLDISIISLMFLNRFKIMYNLYVFLGYIFLENEYLVQLHHVCIFCKF